MARLKAPYFDAYFRAEPRGKFPLRFAVVTAHNPRGKKSAPDLNRRRDAALRRRRPAAAGRLLVRAPRSLVIGV